MGAKEECKKCKFWKFTKPASSARKDIGRCRRFPPANRYQNYPESCFDDWCGEFKKK